MGRFTSACPEISGRFDQPPPKQMLPNSIHGNAAGQGIRGVHEPAREVQPIRLRSAGFELIQDREDAWLNLLAVPEKIASHMDKSGPSVCPFDQRLGESLLVGRHPRGHALKLSRKERKWLDQLLPDNIWRVPSFDQPSGRRQEC